MIKTPNLDLTLTDDSETLFSTWRNSINGNNDGEEEELSNMQKIDNFAGEVMQILGDIDSALSEILGV